MWLDICVATIIYLLFCTVIAAWLYVRSLLDNMDGDGSAQSHHTNG